MIRLSAGFVEGLVYPLVLGLIFGVVAFYRKTTNQSAVQKYRDEHQTDIPGERNDEHTEALIDELRRQIQEQAAQIDGLRREVRDERSARERQELRHTREIGELKDQLSSAETRLGIARGQIKTLQDKEI